MSIKQDIRDIGLMAGGIIAVFLGGRCALVTGAELAEQRYNTRCLEAIADKIEICGDYYETQADTYQCRNAAERMGYACYTSPQPEE